ncbi:hypothetical protein BH09ACT12_BH09ACT12_09030 [soil metagenome]
MRPLGTAPYAPATGTRAPRRQRLLAQAGALLLVAVVPLLSIDPAAADETDVPSRADVRAAEIAAQEGERVVASVRADLALAEIVVEQATIAAQQAAEAFNGARYAAHQARVEAKDARVADRAAQAEVERVRLVYAEVVRGSLGTNRDLSALNSILGADGLTEMLDLTNSYRIVGGTLDARYDELGVARDKAAAASAAAVAARTEVKQTRDEAADKRRDARAAQHRAAEQADSMASRTQELVAELARLQGVSVDVAQRRREGLAARAEAKAAAAQARADAEAAAQAKQAKRDAAKQAEQDAAAAAAEAAAAEEDGAAESAAPEPEEPEEAEPEEAQAAEPEPAPVPDTEPALSLGSAAAVAFARAQLGDRYVWGASGPDAWDCSGLTSGAWAAGGKTLPHYSVAQYEASTPIEASERQPGDLVFWGSSSDPSSIYHVALYIGDDMIIHSPRTGRPVSEDSLFYWIPPTFYARP